MNSLAVTVESRMQVPGCAQFGSLLRLLRRRCGLTQRSLGAAMFFSREYVALVERGLRAPSATFVERAEAALNADGELECTYAVIQRSREHRADQRAANRPIAGRCSKIGTAARRLHRVMQKKPVGDVPAAWLTAVDDLHRALRDELHPITMEDSVAALEQRCADLAVAAGDTVSWADVLSSAALGAADAGALLQRPLRSTDAARAATVASAFAALTADALLMLGHPDRSAEWCHLTDPEHHRPSLTDDQHESAAQPAQTRRDHDEPVVEVCRGALPSRRGPAWRARPPTFGSTRSNRRRVTPLCVCPSWPPSRDGRAPPG